MIYGPANENSESLGQELIIAAKEDNKEAIMDLLARGANVNSTNEFGHCALHYMSLNDNKIAIEAMLNKGANPCLSNKDGQCAIHFAAQSNNLEIVKMLIMANADIDATNIHKETALHFAVYNGHYNIAKHLLENGANPNAVARSNKRAEDDEGKFSILTEARFGWTPLHYAAYKGYADMINLLIEYGTILDATDGRKLTALSIGAKRNLPMVETAILNGAKKVCNLFDLLLSRSEFDGPSKHLDENNQGMESSVKLKI